jgi:diguanylate cyclase (GGDEF)-like protein
MVVAKFAVVLCGFVCGVAGIVLSAVSSERDAASEAFAKLEAADKMNNAMLARESALRGYEQTRNASFLESYDAASGALAEAADIARTEAAGREAQLASISAQERVAQRWAESAGRVIDAIRDGRAGAVRASTARNNLMVLFQEHNEEFHGLVEEQADEGYAAGLQRTVLMILLLSIGFALTAGLLLRRLQRQERERQREEQAHYESQREFTETLQVTENETEAHALVKRHLERTLPASDVVVLNRNNSQNRLEATTPIDAGSSFAERLLDSAPTSCLAIRLGRAHEQSSARKPLLVCALCGLDRRSTCVPSLVGGEVIGSVLVTHDHELEERERIRIEESVSQAAPVLANLRNLAVAEVRAATDALTGLPNARALRDTLKRMVAQALRSELPLAAVLCDLDNFKQINDLYGHDKGDQALAAASAAMRGALRVSDLVGRYGGEEFLILLPDTPLDGAVVLAEKLRQEVSLVDVPGVDRAITASFGVAVFPTDAPDGEMLVRMADRALYAAKGRGRNCVITSAELVPPEA